MALAHAPGNQLCILAAKIQNDDLLRIVHDAFLRFVEKTGEIAPPLLRRATQDYFATKLPCTQPLAMVQTKKIPPAGVGLFGGGGGQERGQGLVEVREFPLQAQKAALAV